MTIKQIILLVVRFLGFAILWYIVAQILLGITYGLINVFTQDHDHQSLAVEEQSVHIAAEFLNSPAPAVIFILSLVVALGVSTLQTLSKMKQYRLENTEK